MLLCITVLALSTEQAFNRELSQCEMLEYMFHSDNEDYDRLKEEYVDAGCFEHYDRNAGTTRGTNFGPGGQGGGDPDIPFDPPEPTPETIEVPELRIRIVEFEILEFLVSGLFTLDLLLRLFSCPSFKCYFLSIVNLVDIFALACFYIYTIYINVQKEYKYTDSWLKIINYAQILRSLRLFRVVKNVRASRVLAFSLRRNLRDMTLLVLLLLIAVSLAGNLIFFIDDRSVFKSIPNAWYWSLITLTTVGYGDLSPSSPGGKVLASILALCGVLFLAITLPMFVNNFLTLYSYSCLDDTIAHKEKSQNVEKIRDSELEEVVRDRSEKREVNFVYGENADTLQVNSINGQMPSIPGEIVK